MMPSVSAALLFVLAAVVQEMMCISVPTGKETPITPAKVTPRPTYHPPLAAPAPVHEYTYDNPEPAPLDPSWIPIPVKYLKVLTKNSILYVPMTIPNPNAFQPTYAIPQTTEKPAQQAETTVAPTYQTQATPEQQYTTTYQKQPEQQYTTTYQKQQEQQQYTTTYQKQPEQSYTTTYQKQPEQQYTTTYQKLPEKQYTPPQKQYDVYQKEAEQVKQPEFGAKVVPKQKWKPYYYLPKGQYKQSTKAGYPKKALASPSQKYYYYYPIPTNAQ